MNDFFSREPEATERPLDGGAARRRAGALREHRCEFGDCRVGHLRDDRGEQPGHLLVNRVNIPTATRSRRQRLRLAMTSKYSVHRCAPDAQQRRGLVDGCVVGAAKRESLGRSIFGGDKWREPLSFGETSQRHFRGGWPPTSSNTIPWNQTEGCSMDVDRFARLRRKLRGLELDERALDELRPFLAEGFRLTIKKTSDAKLPIGVTKIGGAPDLPANVDLPGHDPRGTPMSFVAQVRLADVPVCEGREQLPSDGLLSFFFGFGSNLRPQASVLYTPASKKLVRRTFPSPAMDGDRMESIIDSFSVKLSQSKLFAEYEAPWFADFDTDDEIRDLFDAASPHHVLLGFATRVSPSTLGMRPKKGWVHLLQIDSDDRAEHLQFGDTGSISFWIRKDDLAHQNFEGVKLAFECA